jgi:hypothetical protein
MADRIGRRKAVVATVLNVSLATGAMALTPEGGCKRAARSTEQVPAA